MNMTNTAATHYEFHTAQYKADIAVNYSWQMVSILFRQWGSNEQKKETNLMAKLDAYVDK